MNLILIGIGVVVGVAITIGALVYIFKDFKIFKS